MGAQAERLCPAGDGGLEVWREPACTAENERSWASYGPLELGSVVFARVLRRDRVVVG